jgi:hypothetical protein
MAIVSSKLLEGPDWLHEIKYDGYRRRLERDGDRVRLITKGGHNWTDRYPWIVSGRPQGSPATLSWTARPWCSGSMASPTTTANKMSDLPH